MSLSFLVPIFLVGLAALAIPVLIHLTRRQTRESVQFPSLMFLRRIPHPSTQRRRIHRWPLLLLRLAALALLVLAFARPFLQREDGAPLLAASAGGRELVVLLDRSYSMGAGDRWERAVNAARQAVDGLAPGDRATLLLFDSRSEAVTETTSQPAVLRAALADARPGPRSTRYAPALRHAQRVLAGSPLPRREVVVISDFQRAGWDADAAEVANVRLPTGTTVTPVSVAGEIGANAAVASLAFGRSVSAGRELVAVTARVAGRDGREGSTLPVTLEVNGRAVETRDVALPAEGVGTVEFGPVILPEAGPIRGRVHIPADALPADDAFHFAVSADQRIPVLIIQGPAAGGSFFLERALQIGDAPGFRVVVRRPGEVRAADLASRPVVVLNQAPLPDGEIGRRLRTLVEEGGGLVAVLGDNRPGEWNGVLPTRLAAVDHSSRGGTSLGYVDVGHPVFEPFSTPRSGDFTAARVYRYRGMDPGGFQRILARFGDGGAALAEQRAGKGRVLVWTSPLDGSWNDLAVQPVFLPFLHQLVKYAAGYTPARPAFTVGDPFDAAAATTRAAASVVLTPSGERMTLEETTPLSLDEPGFYELRDQRTGARAATLAVNVDRAEANLEAFDPQELVSAVGTGTDTGTAAAAEAASLTLGERERQQSAWWYLIVVAFLLLAAETVLSNRATRNALAPPAPTP